MRVTGFPMPLYESPDWADALAYALHKARHGREHRYGVRKCPDRCGMWRVWQVV